MKNFKRMAGGHRTKNQEGVVTGAKIWPDLVLRQNGMWALECWGSPNVPHSTAASKSGQRLQAAGASAVQKLAKEKLHFSHGREWHLHSCLSTFILSHLPVELSGHLRFCCHHLRRQERIGKL